MSSEIKNAIKSAILEVLKEEKKSNSMNLIQTQVDLKMKGLSSEQKKITSEKISKFGKYQKFIALEAKDMDVAKDICNIVENASKYILNETDDWFDAISVKRNLKRN